MTTSMSWDMKNFCFKVLSFPNLVVFKILITKEWSWFSSCSYLVSLIFWGNWSKNSLQEVSAFPCLNYAFLQNFRPFADRANKKFGLHEKLALVFLSLLFYSSTHADYGVSNFLYCTIWSFKILNLTIFLIMLFFIICKYMCLVKHERNPG